jgi:tripartite-type tricarboxylate transporter receptor subunit TctC
MHESSRHRNCARLACVAALTAWLPHAHAQEFPSQAVSIVVPYPVSGPTDIRGTSRLTKTYKLLAQNAPPAISDTLARIAADAIRQGTRQQVRLERQPGGATTTGATRVARGRADGHTLLLASDATLLIAPHYYLNVKYDETADFVLVAPLATMPFVLMANATLPIDDVKTLMAWLKVRPGEVNYASSGDGSTGHIAGERFLRMTNLNAVHVSYNGGIAALNAVATRHVSYMFAAMPLALPYLDNRYVRPFAVTTSARLRHLPHIPTLAESGVPGYEVEGWYGIFVAAHTPPRAVAWLSEHLAVHTSAADVQQRLREQGLQPVTASRSQFATRINTEAFETAAFLQQLAAASPRLR